MTGGINFISVEERADIDKDLVGIATKLLNLTKNSGNQSQDYDLNCVIGAYASSLRTLSNKIEDLRQKDIEEKYIQQGNPPVKVLCHCGHKEVYGDSFIHAVKLIGKDKTIDLCDRCFEKSGLLQLNDTNICNWEFFNYTEQNKYFIIPRKEVEEHNAKLNLTY